jgi:hypothetical protein
MTSKRRERQWAITEIRKVMGYELPRPETQRKGERRTSPQTVTVLILSNGGRQVNFDHYIPRV